MLVVSTYSLPYARNFGYYKQDHLSDEFCASVLRTQRSIQEWNQDELNKCLIKDKISCHLCPRSEWNFQPPTASHMNGVWERLIRSVWKSMKAILRNQNALLGLETLRTVFAEVLTILRSHPLTPSSDNPIDFEPLTPSHFLLQWRNLALPPGLFVSEDLYRRKQWRKPQFLADCFWKRWMREYIPTLQQRHKWVREKGSLAIRDLVLVVDDNSLRGWWLLGRVFKTSWPWSPGPCSQNQDKKWYLGQTNLQAVLAWGSSLSIITSKMTLNYVSRTLFFRTVYGLFIGVIEPTNT